MAYIDKEKLKNALPHKTPYDRYGNGFNDCLERVHDAIDNVPDADVVEVVRCKDCKYWKHEEDVDLTCDEFCGYRASNDFCSYGERKGGV